MFHGPTWEWYTALPETWQRLILAAIVLAMGWPAIGIVRKGTGSALGRMQRLDATLRVFAATVFAVVSWILLVVIVLGIAGVDVAALIGGLAIGGFIIGFAVKDTLGNLAAGILLLVQRPYRVGEVVEVAGSTGRVLELGMAMTRLREGSGKIIIIPNSDILGSAIVNHTREPTRQAAVQVGIGYGDDIDPAFRAILDALAGDERILKEPRPGVQIRKLGADAVELNVTGWVMTGDLGAVAAAMPRLVKEAMEGAGCTIPYPQRDVHLYEETGRRSGEA